VFIATVGTSRYQPIEYVVSEGASQRIWQTAYSPVATARLLLSPDGKERVRTFVLCTEEAREAHYAQLAGELRDAGCEPEPVIIGMGRTQQEQLEILETLASVVPKDARITADFTLSLRSLGLAFIAALAELVALRDAVVDAVASTT